MTEPTPVPPDDLQLLTVREVCELLRVTRSWLYDQVQTGKFPVQRVGTRSLRFRRSDVMAYYEGHYQPARRQEA